MASSTSTCVGGGGSKPSSAGPETAGISFATALSSMADQLSTVKNKTANYGSETNLFDRLSEKRMEEQGRFRDRSASTSGAVGGSRNASETSRFPGITPGGIFSFGATSTWAPPNFTYSEIDANWEPKFIDFGTSSGTKRKQEPQRRNSAYEMDEGPGVFMQETLV